GSPSDRLAHLAQRLRAQLDPLIPFALPKRQSRSDEEAGTVPDERGRVPGILRQLVLAGSHGAIQARAIAGHARKEILAKDLVEPLRGNGCRGRAEIAEGEHHEHCSDSHHHTPPRFDMDGTARKIVAFGPTIASMSNDTLKVGRRALLTGAAAA